MTFIPKKKLGSYVPGRHGLGDFWSDLSTVTSGISDIISQAQDVLSPGVSGTLVPNPATPTLPPAPTIPGQPAVNPNNPPTASGGLMAVLNKYGVYIAGGVVALVGLKWYMGRK